MRLQRAVDYDIQATLKIDGVFIERRAWLKSDNEAVFSSMYEKDGSRVMGMPLTFTARVCVSLTRVNIMAFELIDPSQPTTDDTNLVKVTDIRALGQIIVTVRRGTNTGQSRGRKRPSGHQNGLVFEKQAKCV